MTGRGQYPRFRVSGFRAGTPRVPGLQVYGAKCVWIQVELIEFELFRRVMQACNDLSG